MVRMRLVSAGRSTGCKAFALALAAGALAAGCAPMMSSREEQRDERIAVMAAGGLKLAVEDRGKGDPVLLIHGLGTSNYSWRHVMPALARTNRVIAIDLKGFGASDKPADGKYSVKDQAAIVQAFIEQENLKNLTVIGHSFGGGVALSMALKLADEKSGRLKRLVLIDTIAYKQPLPVFFEILTTPGVGAVSMALIPPEVQISEALHIAYHNDQKIPAEAITEYARPLHEAGAKEALRKTVEQIVPPDIEAIAARYKTISLPTLVIWCENDKIIPLSYGRRLAQDIKGAGLHIIPKCGHLPQEEAPEQTLKAITQFLGKGRR